MHEQPRQPELRRAGGFTLLELILVMLLVGVLAGLAVPRYVNSLNYYRADLSAKRIAADLNQSRSSAWAAGEHRTVTFNTGANQYVLTAVPDANQRTADTTVDLSDSPYASTLASTSLTGGQVVFDGYGLPSAGGQITVQAGNFSRTVTVNAATGAISVP